MSARRDASAANPPESLAQIAEMQAQEAVDHAVAASDKAMRAALDSTAHTDAADGTHAALEAMALAEQALAAALSGAAAGEAAVANASRHADEAEARAVEAAQQQAQQATAAAEAGACREKSP